VERKAVKKGKCESGMQMIEKEKKFRSSRKFRSGTELIAVDVK
jgi:hypothetical protein